MEASLSVVLDNYNGAVFLDDLLGDLERQTIPPRDILVVDNGSRDASREIVRAHPQATWMEASGNQGYGSAANAGLGRVRGSLILVGNTDLRVPETFVASALEAFAKHPEAALISPLILRFDGLTVDSAGQYPAWNLHVRERGFGKALETLPPLREGPCFSVCGAATLISRNALEDLCLEGNNLYDPDFFMFWEDFELGWRAQRRGLNVHFAPAIRIRHFRSATLTDKTAPRRGLARSRPPAIRAHIILNRYLTLIRHLSWGTFLKHLPILAVYDSLWLLWLLLPDFRPLPHLWRNRHKFSRAWTRRKEAPPSWNEKPWNPSP